VGQVRRERWKGRATLVKAIRPDHYPQVLPRLEIFSSNGHRRTEFSQSDSGRNLGIHCGSNYYGNFDGWNETRKNFANPSQPSRALVSGDGGAGEWDFRPTSSPSPRDHRLIWPRLPKSTPAVQAKYAREITKSIPSSQSSLRKLSFLFFL